MPKFDVKGRKVAPITTVSVTADTRELAIEQVVASAKEGEEFEVMEVTEAGEAPAPKKGKSDHD